MPGRLSYSTVSHSQDYGDNLLMLETASVGAQAPHPTHYHPHHLLQIRTSPSECQAPPLAPALAHSESMEEDGVSAYHDSLLAKVATTTTQRGTVQGSSHHKKIDLKNVCQFLGSTSGRVPNHII